MQFFMVLMCIKRKENLHREAAIRKIVYRNGGYVFTKNLLRNKMTFTYILHKNTLVRIIQVLISLFLLC